MQRLTHAAGIGLKRFLHTQTGYGVLAAILVVVIFSPAIIFGRPGLTFVFGLVFGFYGGFQYARKLWSRRGYVPKYDDLGKD